MCCELQHLESFSLNEGLFAINIVNVKKMELIVTDISDHCQDGETGEPLVMTLGYQTTV